MLAWIKNEWDYLYGTFHGSETILWSRLNIAIGSAWVALQGSDLSPVISNPKYIAYWVIFSNFINELFRRRHAEYDDHGNMK